MYLLAERECRILAGVRDLKYGDFVGHYFLQLV